MKNIKTFEQLSSEFLELNKTNIEIDRARKRYVIEDEKLSTLEEKYLKKDMSKLIDSHNLNQIQKYIEFLKENDIKTDLAVFLYQEIYKIKSNDKIESEDITIDYTKYTDEVILELKNQIELRENVYSEISNLERLRDEQSKKYQNSKK